MIRGPDICPLPNQHHGISFHISLKQTTPTSNESLATQVYLYYLEIGWIDVHISLKNSSLPMHKFDVIFPHEIINMIGVLKQYELLLVKKQERDILLYFHFQYRRRKTLTIKVRIIEEYAYHWEGLARLREERPGFVISITQGFDRIILENKGELNGTMKLYFFN